MGKLKKTNKKRMRGTGDNTQTNEDSTGIKQGGMVTGKEAGQEEHMADNNKHRAMCSDTKQTET